MIQPSARLTACIVIVSANVVTGTAQGQALTGLRYQAIDFSGADRRRTP